MHAHTHVCTDMNKYTPKETPTPVHSGAFYDQFGYVNEEKLRSRR